MLVLGSSNTLNIGFISTKYPNMETRTASIWYVYMVRCADNSLYTGITTSLSKRVAEHNSAGKACAKYTRTRRPVTLVYYEQYDSRSLATKRELDIKHLSKPHKEALIFQKNHKNRDVLSFFAEHTIKNR